MKKTLVTTGLIASLLAATGAGVVMAQSTATAPSLTAVEAIEIALAEVPGEVQEAELDRDDDLPVYEIEILTAEGVEMEVEINAETGEILEIEADDKD
ncbi:MAG: PepSY domain-containing protein [Devosiaceae bacterium]|nr:PepSY domain-containing protein [Devosiaceae bacterium MH13]